MVLLLLRDRPHQGLVLLRYAFCAVSLRVKVLRVHEAALMGLIDVHDAGLDAAERILLYFHRQVFCKSLFELHWRH